MWSVPVHKWGLAVGAEGVHTLRCQDWGERRGSEGPWTRDEGGVLGDCLRLTLVVQSRLAAGYCTTGMVSDGS